MASALLPGLGLSLSQWQQRRLTVALLLFVAWLFPVLFITIPMVSMLSALDAWLKGRQPPH